MVMLRIVRLKNEYYVFIVYSEEEKNIAVELTYTNTIYIFLNSNEL